jgi:hypothetical protein
MAAVVFCSLLILIQYFLDLFLFPLREALGNASGIQCSILKCYLSQLLKCYLWLNDMELKSVRDTNRHQVLDKVYIISKMKLMLKFCAYVTYFRIIVDALRIMLSLAQCHAEC